MAKRAYGNRYPSVTTIVGDLFRPNLDGWYQAVGFPEAKAYTDERRKEGQNVHDIVERVLKGEGFTAVAGEFSEAEQKAASLFLTELREVGGTPVLMEEALTSDSLKINGTPDLVLKKGGEYLLVDYKYRKHPTQPLKLYQRERTHFYQAAGYSLLLDDDRGWKVKEALYLTVDPVEHRLVRTPVKGLIRPGRKIFKNLREVWADYHRR